MVGVGARLRMHGDGTPFSFLWMECGVWIGVLCGCVVNFDFDFDVENVDWVWRMGVCGGMRS